MSDDRYAPPTAPLVREDLPGEGGEFTIERSLGDGWRLTWENFGLLLGVLFVGGGLILFSISTVIGAFLVAPVLYYGVVRVCLQLVDRGARFADLWSGFREYGHALSGMLVIFVATFLIGLIGSIPGWLAIATGNEALASAANLVEWSFTIFVGSRLLFAGYHVVDQATGPIEAMQRSWDETGRWMGRSAGFFVLQGLIVIGGLLLLGVGVIPAIFIAQLATASAYRQMVPRTRSADA